MSGCNLLDDGVESKDVSLESKICSSKSENEYNSPVSQRFSPSGEQLEQRKLAHTL